MYHSNLLCVVLFSVDLCNSHVLPAVICPSGLSLFIDLHPRVKTQVEVWMQVVCWLLCFGMAGALVLQKDQVAQHAIKLYRGKGATHGHSWVASNCKRLVGLLRQKNVVVKKLAAAADAVGRDLALSEPERHFQVADRPKALYLGRNAVIY